MSVAYQSWEVASGPTMGYNMAIQSRSNMCAESPPPDASSYNGNTLVTLNSPDSLFRALASSSDMSNSLNSKVPMQPEHVIKGFSSLSLHPPQEVEAMNSKGLDLNQLNSKESTTHGFASQHRMPGSAFDLRNPTAFVSTLDKNLRSLSPLHSCLAKSSFPEGCHGFLDAYNTAKHTLDVVVEDKALEDGCTRVCNGSGDDFEIDSLSSLSTHSISSLHDMPGDGQTSSGDGSSGTGEAEVQSAYRGLSSSYAGTSPPKKGLSRFYAGKSRSFSCLADVVSVKDLAKPESPYAKKRKCNVGRSLNGRPQLPPLQKGVASISKRLPHNNGKSTLVLAVVMSAKEEGCDATHEKGLQKCAGMERWQGSSLASRSYSLSDLQGVANKYISPS